VAFQEGRPLTNWVFIEGREPLPGRQVTGGAPSQKSASNVEGY